MRVLLTGAAGFIGGAVGAELVRRGHEVVGIDAWIPQAHRGGTSPDRERLDDGTGGSTEPSAGSIEVRRTDVRDPAAVGEALRAVDVVCHQAAMVGAGLTAADLPLYASHNDVGTAVLLAEMAAAGVRRLVLASSMVVYGDGAYSCAAHGRQDSAPRRRNDLQAGRFDVGCPRCGEPMHWELVDETAPVRPMSGYAASKVAQEHYALAWARQLPACVTALRYHNVYGPWMPRDTPYSGVAAMFRSSVERGQAPRVFEDGAQMRDFVHVFDVARANASAVEQAPGRSEGEFRAFNVCSGRPISIGQVASTVAAATSRGSTGVAPVTTGEFRSGDVRHVVASPARAAAELGFTAETAPADGLARFATAPLRS